MRDGDFISGVVVVGDGGQELAGVDSADVLGVGDVPPACCPDSVRSDWDGCRTQMKKMGSL